MNVFAYEFQGNTTRAWLTAAALGLVLGFAMTTVRRIAARRVTALGTSRLSGLAAELLGSLRWWFLALVAAYVALSTLALPERFHGMLRGVVVVSVAVQAGLLGLAVIRHAAEAHVAERDDDNAAKTTAMFAAVGARIVLWTLLLLLLLDNLGVNITSLLTGLGVGGVAVALAVQNVLGDVLASLSIALDQPFVVGDFIVVDSLAGTVEHIGMKTTRVRALSGEQLVFSNGDLLRSRLHNYKHLVERRIVQNFGVLYQTPADQLAAIPDMVREAVDGESLARFDRAHFKGLGASSLDFEFVYYVLDADYAKHMDVQQRILLAIIRRFEAADIGFAFPTQTIYLQRPAPAALPATARQGTVAPS
jgi:small-conductance mechanosensitive channel